MARARRVPTPPLIVAALSLCIGLLSACQTLPRTAVAVPAVVDAGPVQAPTPLPNREGSLKFAVLGDFGTGSRVQYQLAEQLAKLNTTFRFNMAILVGDNLYGGQRPADFQRKFEIPYKPLLDTNVKFYASLGNHDTRNQRFYKLFNMDGKLFYSFKAPEQNVRFFALESSYPVPAQITWVKGELESSKEDWKIAFFHHPLYSSGEKHGSDTQLRDVLEPLFVQNNVSVVFSGHDHFYERVKPQKGIAYFVVGNSGKLREGNIDRTTGLTARGLDTDLSFLAAEIIGDELTFNTISRSGQVVDSGVITRRK
ncbi:MAG: metallophosphoesterase [Vicinamibacterales bacterium]